MKTRATRLSGLTVCLVLLLGLNSLLEGQSDTGQLRGTVKDPSGERLAQVAVALSGRVLASEKTAKTDDTGSYTFSALLPGLYELSFRLNGFAPEKRTGVEVSAGAASVLNATLQVAREYSVALTIASASASVITNEASVTMSTQESKPGDEKTIEETTVTSKADLSVGASDSADPVIAGNSVSYVVTVSNKGPSDARYVEVSNTPPPGTTFQSTSGCEEDPRGLPICTLGTIAAGSSRQYTISLTVDSGTTGSITNQASVSSQTTEAKPGDESTSEETRVGARADLSISSRDSVDPVVAGEPLTYIITVKNNGPSDARDVVVNNALPDGVVFMSTGGCAEDAGAGGGIPTCTLGTITARSQKEFSILVHVNSDATGVLTNRANVVSSTKEDEPGDESIQGGGSAGARPPAGNDAPRIL